MRIIAHYQRFFYLRKPCKYQKFGYLCSVITQGAIAQLVEQRTENPCVPGSIPGGTTFKRLQIW